MDLQGILGIDNDVRNGFGGIKVTYKIDADAKREYIEAPRCAIPEAVGGL